MRNVYLSTDHRRVNIDPLIIKATHTNAKENLWVRSFVTHSGEIISHDFYACSKSKQSDKIPPARRPQKTLGLPAGGFCVYRVPVIVSLREAISGNTVQTYYHEIATPLGLAMTFETR